MKRALTTGMVFFLSLIMFGLVTPAFAVSAGDYIVAEYSTEKLSMVTPGGVRTEIYSFQIGTYDEYPIGVAIDGAGNYIVTTQDENYYAKLWRLTPSGDPTLVYSALNQGYGGVAVDGAGDYIVAESGTYPALSKITPVGVRTVIYNYYSIFGFLIYPQAVAIDGAGNYIVTESHAGELNTLSKITPGGARTVIYTFAAGQWPNFVAVDGAGNYIVTDYVDDTLCKITPAGVRTVIYDFGGGSQVEGVAVDSAGNYIVAESYAQKLSKTTPGGVKTPIYSFVYYTDPHGVAIVPGAAGYSATIWSWDYILGWPSVPITMDGVPTGYSTPHTFTGLTGTHTFTVPSTNPAGHPFSDWDTGWTDRTITVSEAGTYTARYRAGYSATIWSWCANEGWLSSPITKDGVSTGYSTPYTFADLTGTHTFTAPATDASGHTFYEWSTGSMSRTLTVSSAGVYTARYRAADIIDNRDANTSRTGTWGVSGAPNPYGADSVWSRDGATFTWKFTPTVTGAYDLSMWWTQWPSRSTNIPVDIQYAGGTARVYINQQVNGGKWNLVGNYNFNAGTTYSVKITAQPGPSSTCADAVKFNLSTQPPPVIIVDNSSTNTSKTGTWDVSGAPNPYGADSVWSRDGATFTWKFTPTVTGAYDLSMWWTQWPSRSTNIPVDIQYAGGTARVYINQQVNGGKWNLVGNYNFNAGTTYSVKITSQPGPSSTCADAVKFSLSTQPPPLIVDNSSTNTSKTGTWYVSGAPNPYGADSVWSRDGATFTWKFTPTVTGAYDLSMWWTQWPSRSTNIPVDIQYAGGTARVYINQQVNGGKWNLVGNYNFNVGTTYSVKITAQPGPSSTCADAVKFNRP